MFPGSTVSTFLTIICILLSLNMTCALKKHGWAVQSCPMWQSDIKQEPLGKECFIFHSFTKWYFSFLCDYQPHMILFSIIFSSDAMKTNQLKLSSVAI